MTSGAREAENALLSPSKYDRLALAQVPRYQWLPGYRDRVPWIILLFIYF